ncbi:MAG: HD domain-containing protein [Eubacteriales bacterium]
MNYLKINNVKEGMVLSRPIIGDTGSVLLGSGAKISASILKRLKSMGYQGIYIEMPAFANIVVDDSISQEVRTRAFDVVKSWDIEGAVRVSRQIVKDLRYKDTLKLDLLDIKCDDNYIIRHSIAVCIFATVMGISAQLTEEQVEQLAVAGLLHDIGITELNESVKNSRLIFDTKDMDEMMKHPMFSYELVKDNAYVSSVSRNAILFHHENLDGSGYYKEEADHIGLYARIIRIADTYDSLTSMKPYREAQSPAQAIEYLMANAGVLFDRELVQNFVQKVPIYPVGFTVKLSNGQLGVISDNHGNSMRPEVTLLSGTRISLANDPEYRTVMIADFV